MAQEHGPLRVLVVDDEALIRWAVAETLVQAGLDVVEARDAQSALAAVSEARQAFDVILLDLRLPDCADLTLLSRIRQQSPESAVVMMTAYATSEVAAEAWKLGVYDVLLKPFDVTGCERIVRQADAAAIRDRRSSPRQTSDVPRRLAAVFAFVVTAVAIGGCATLSTSSHVDERLDFARLRTFDWGAPDKFPVGDARLDKNPIFLDYLYGAVEKQLEARGYERVVTGRPQLLIHFHASIDRRLNVNTADARYGYCLNDDCRAGVAEFEAGTIIIDIIDARTNRLVWRGWAQDSVDAALEDRERLVRMVETGVARMFAGLPPGALKGLP